MFSGIFYILSLLIDEIKDEIFSIAKWIGEEVSYDSRHYNSSLISNPFTIW